MDYELTSHAKERLKERKISERLLREAINYPTQTDYDAYGNILIKKLYSKTGKTRLLLIAGLMENNKLKIFTIIDTSKVSKYL